MGGHHDDRRVSHLYDQPQINEAGAMIALIDPPRCSRPALAMSAWADLPPQPKIQPATIDDMKPRLTVLYDAFAKPTTCESTGLLGLGRSGGKRILFIQNDPVHRREQRQGQRRGPGDLDCVVRSITTATIWAPYRMSWRKSHGQHLRLPRSFGIYGSSLPSSFYRKAEAQPAEMHYFDGYSPEVMKFGTAWPGANFELIDRTTEVAPGVHLIALISDKPGTLEPKELSLAIDTQKASSSWSDVAPGHRYEIVEETTAISKRIHLIAGGLHLVVAQAADHRQDRYGAARNLSCGVDSSWAFHG